tara:strand:- start:144 stop:1829 length:1686 start_codon:yes stop_codon:yes gene_type:complete
MNIPQEMLDDFRNHLWGCFKYLGIGEPTPAQYAMAEALQDGPEDMQLQAGRGFGKSVITACLASWFLLQNPNTVIMVISATSNKAAEFISMTRRILDVVPYCEHLKPGDHTTDNAFGFNVECRTKIGQDKSCFARGISSQITGSHADFVIADDVEIEGNCETTHARDKLLNKVSEFEQIRNVGGRVIFLGTPQIRDSIYNSLKEGYPITKFPAVIPDKHNEAESENVNQWVWDLQGEIGDATQPERFSSEVLEGRKAKIGPRLFALHYKLDTSLADAEKYPLRLSDLIVLDLDQEVCPEKIVWASSVPLKKVPSFGMSGDMLYEPMWVSDNYSNYTQTLMFIDPSGRGRDETGVCVSSFANGYVFIHELLGLDGGYDKSVLIKICQMARDYKIRSVFVESNFGDAMFCQLLAPVAAEICGRNLGIEEFRVKGQKEARMLEVLEPVLAQHRLVFNRKAIISEETQKQITRLHDSRGALSRDDRVDVLSAAIAHWTESMHLDVDTILQRNKAQAREEIVKTWLSDDRVMGLWGDKLSGAVARNEYPFENNNTNNLWKRRGKTW